MALKALPLTKGCAVVCLVCRVTTKPTRLGPYDLPPDTPIWVNVYGFHNSSRNFRDADK